MPHIAAGKTRKVLIYSINYAPEMIGVGRSTSEIGAYLDENALTFSWSPHRHITPAGVPSCPIPLGAMQAKPARLREKIHGIWRLLAPLSFALTSAPVALWKIVTQRPDIVLCVEPTVFAAPVGDLLKQIAVSLESWLLRRFSSVITISEQMRKRLIAKGVAADRIGLMRNWVDLTKIKPLAGENAFRAELGLNLEDFIVFYAGNIGAKQSLDVVVEAARQLAGTPRVHFVIAGDGPEKMRLMENCATLPNVHFLPL
jgi:colanic acid biosynthesis glycosyl transferase WcaI